MRITLTKRKEAELQYSITNFLRWKDFKERMVVVTESLHYLDKLLIYEDLKVRAEFCILCK